MRITNEHNHAANPDNPELIRFKNRIKDAAIHSRDMPRQIIANALLDTQHNVRLRVRRSNAQRDICRIRQREHVEPPNPQNIVDLIIPLPYQLIGN